MRTVAGRLLVLVLVTLICALTGVLVDPAGVAVAASRPDIVVFYLDDIPPYPGRLWRNARRTPELERFTHRGVTFANAVSATPMCGPARGNVLTGRYAHRTGIVANDIAPYDQAGTIAPRLDAVGYRTVFIGKHINGLRTRYPTADAMSRLADGWDRFEPIWEDGGRYYDWRQYRKGRPTARRFGDGPRDHSTFRATTRAVRHIRRTPADEPLFLFLSLYDGHAPLTPLARFEGDQRCRAMRAWSGPAYDEADVSDKPAYVRALPRRGSDGYSLRDRCEQQLTVDWAVGKVRRALQAKGRYADTLQVITADNGFLLGDHRIVGKTDAYSTPVPLYVRWPRVTGTGGRRVAEPVSSVDLPVTFCALAGCTLPGTDGLDISPLIRGTKARLERDYLYVEMPNGTGCHRSAAFTRPAWAGVETTLRYSATRWAYTRYQTGEEELYDLSADPHRLANLAPEPRVARVLADLRGFRKEVWDAHGVQWCHR